jgi:hairy-and-enhancer-of-split protein
MEKRRRARINNCLNELKTLILDAMKKDVSAGWKTCCQSA